ncbi:MAG: hypothetical protein NT121_22215, partial [Chloroflexi bacterium]|nr:hypothetical protein [Chloroflexota bacterium]
MKNKRNLFFRILMMLILGGLLYWALRNAPLVEIWATIWRLKAWQIGVLALLNTLIYILVSLRWWIIVQAEARRVAFLPLLAVR